MIDCKIVECGLDSHGYGQVYRDGKLRLAHRLAYIEANGMELSDIDGLCVLHSCDTPACVEPAHLRTGTQAENMRDMVKRGRCGKLSPEQVEAIRRDTRLHREIAADYGVTRSNISYIKNGKSWK